MPEDETITFEYVRKVQREEFREARLSKLPDGFYRKVKDYLEEKRKLLKKKEDRSSSLEAINIQRLLEDVFNRRETKIINHALITARTDIPPPNLTEEEKEFFESIVDSLKSRRNNVLYKLFKKREELEKVKFLDSIEEFVGIDLKKYGPFNKGDVSRIPIDNAELLIKAKKAKAYQGG